jgi:hypothetical protein
MASQTHYQPCEECGAPLDPQQRYCVHCAARRGNGANPASRYFAAMSKRARRPPPARPAKSPSGRAAAVGFFALLPIAVAIGVLVGRGGSNNNDQALLDALRHQNASVATSSARPTATASTKAKPTKAKNAIGRASTNGGGKVLAKTRYGTVHQVTGYKPTKHETEKDTQLVQKNVKQVGKNYIKAQTNLPDVIVVGGPNASSGGH